MQTRILRRARTISVATAVLTGVLPGLALLSHVFKNVCVYPYVYARDHNSTAHFLARHDLCALQCTPHARLIHVHTCTLHTCTHVHQVARRYHSLFGGAPSPTCQRESAAAAGRSKKPPPAIRGRFLGLPSSAEDRAAERGKNEKKDAFAFSLLASIHLYIHIMIILKTHDLFFFSFKYFIC